MEGEGPLGQSKKFVAGGNSGRNDLSKVREVKVIVMGEKRGRGRGQRGHLLRGEGETGLSRNWAGCDKY